MKKSLLVFLLCLLVFFVFGQNDRTEERIIKNGDKDFGKIDKQIYKYKGNLLVEVTNILTKDASAKNGFYKQINYLDKDGTYLYEIWFTNEKTESTNCISLREYVDKEDNIVKFDYMMQGNRLFQLDTETSKSFKNFSVKSLEIYSDYGEKTNNQNAYIIEANYERGIANIICRDKQEIVSQKEKTLIKKWCDSRNIADCSDLYENKIEVEENGKKYFILIQNSVLRIIPKNKSILLSYYYIGKLKEGSVFLAIDYAE